MTREPRDRGATLPIVAILLPVLILMTAFAVDLGRQRSSRRTMQARADIVALDMVRLADGRTEDQITGVDASGGTTPALYEAYIQQSADRNEVDRSKLVVEWGTWNGSAFVQTLGNAVPNAAQVIANEETDYFFRPGSGDVVRSAVATRSPFTRFSLGSTLLQASLGNSSLLNPVLTGLLCSAAGVPPPVAACPNQATFSAASYQGLANNDLDLESLRAAGNYGSVDELMQQDLTASEFASLAAQAFRNNGDPTTADLYDGAGNSLASRSITHSGTFRMGDVVAAESPSDQASARADLNPFEVFMAGLEVANGNNFVDLSNAIPPVSLPLGISNLALTSRYQLIQKPVIGEGEVGDPGTMPPIVRTAQIRLVHSLTFNLNLSVAGTGVSGTVTLPVDVSGGGAEGTLTRIRCADPVSASGIDVTVAPRPIVGTVGTLFTPASPATVGNVNLTVAGLPVGLVGLSAYGSIGPGSQSTAGTSLPNILIDETRSGGGSGFTLGGAITNVKLQTAVGGLTAITSSITTSLNALLTNLSTASRPALGALGMSISSSDVRTIAVDCQSIRLAA